MKLKLKIFKKYFAITSVVIVLSLVFMLMVLSFFVSNYLADEKHEALKKSCEAISEFTSTREVSGGTLLSISGSVTPIIADAIDAEFLITDIRGKSVYCSCDLYKNDRSCDHTKENVSKRINEITLETDEFYEVGNFDGNLNDMYYIYGTKLRDRSGEAKAIVYAFSQTSSIKYIFMNVFRMFLMASVVTIIIMFFAVYYVSYRLTKPLTLMSEAARCMARGDFSKRIPITSDDEVGELAAAFNNMTDSLVQLESTRRGFIANVSHELKTPMTTIGGFIDGIIDGTIDEEKRTEYLKIVSVEVKRLSRLVQSMLGLARLESGETRINPTEIDLASMIIDITFAQQQRIEAKELEIEGLDKLPKLKLYADRDLIHQVVYNLVDNAVKFSNDGGRIAFCLGENNDKVFFAIRNTGEGIAETDLPYIFERFYKSDRARSKIKDSTGLGLFIVKTIIDIHGGEISVKSIPDSFTEFSFYLPKNI